MCGEGKFTQGAGAAAMTIRPADAAHGVRTANLPSGEAIPSLGQGTWGMAEDARRREAEIAALRVGYAVASADLTQQDLQRVARLARDQLEK